jgi:hypothetical protein
LIWVKEIQWPFTEMISHFHNHLQPTAGKFFCYYYEIEVPRRCIHSNCSS